MESAPPTPTPAPSPPPTPQVAPFAVDPDQAAFLLRQQTTWAQPPLYTYNSDREDPQPTPGYVSFDYEGIYVSSTGEASDSDPRISDLGGNRDPVFSPDGRWIAYIHVSGDFETSFVRITDRFGQSVRLIEGDYSAASLNGLSWSADGRLIAFADSDAGGVSIMDVTTGALRMVVGKTGEDISWSPDGQRIAFWVREGSDGNDDDGWVLYVVAPDGSNLTRVTEPDDRRGEFGPLLWTYDSRSLTFVSFPVFGESRGNYETWIVSADGSDPQLMQTGIVVIDQRYYPWLRYRGPGDIWETSVVAAGAYPAIPDY
jgi:WD40 repeat protein